MKRKTNEQKMKQLLKELDTVEVAIITAMLGHYCDSILENEDETRRMYDNHIFSADLMIDVSNKIKTILG
jgi:hypothetical protein